MSAAVAAISQLVATGAIDQELTNNPTVTYWRYQHFRHTPFALHSQILQFTGSQNVGATTATCPLKRSGDLVTRMYVIIDLPGIANVADIPANANESLRVHYQWMNKLNPHIGTLPDSVTGACAAEAVSFGDKDGAQLLEYTRGGGVPLFGSGTDDIVVKKHGWAADGVSGKGEDYGTIVPVRDGRPGGGDNLDCCVPYWCNGVGFRLIKEATLDMGNQAIHTVYSDFMFMYNELSQKPMMSIDEMVGLGDVDTLVRRSKFFRRLHVPLPFWFSKTTGSALPLVSLQFHSVSVKIDWNDIASCVVNGSGIGSGESLSYKLGSHVRRTSIPLRTVMRNNEIMIGQSRHGGALAKYGFRIAPSLPADVDALRSAAVDTGNALTSIALFNEFATDVDRYLLLIGDQANTTGVLATRLALDLVIGEDVNPDEVRTTVDRIHASVNRMRAYLEVLGRPRNVSNVASNTNTMGLIQRMDDHQRHYFLTAYHRTDKAATELKTTDSVGGGQVYTTIHTRMSNFLTSRETPLGRPYIVGQSSSFTAIELVENIGNSVSIYAEQIANKLVGLVKTPATIMGELAQVIIAGYSLVNQYILDGTEPRNVLKEYVFDTSLQSTLDDQMAIDKDKEGDDYNLRSAEDITWFSGKALQQPPKNTLDATHVNAQIECMYVYLDLAERNKFSSGSFQLLYSEVSKNTRKSSIRDTHVELDLDFTKSVIELIVAVRQRANSASGRNAWFNFGGVVEPLTKQVQDPVVSMGLSLNNSDRFYGNNNGQYFRTVQPFQHHTRIPSTFIYSYSFAVYPESESPSGQANFSEIDTKKLSLVLDPNLFTDNRPYGGEDLSENMAEVIVYARNWNLLRLQNGMAGRAYA